MRRTISAITLLPVLLIAAASLSAGPPADESAGASTFKAKCATCHGPDGSGSTPMGQRMKVRDLRSPEVQKQTDDELGAIITNGKPPMPGYGKILTPEEMRQVVAYLRTIARKS
jgi:mono/diheme cytochrome c family protein